MDEKMIGRVFRRAANDGEFRRRALHNLGMALAEEGFILTDPEMRELRESWEPLQSLTDRVAYERVMALARQHTRAR